MALPELSAALAETPPQPVAPPKSIVLAVGGEAHGDNAVATAHKLSELTGARIHVVSVAEPPPMPAVATPFLPDLALPPLPTPLELDALKAAQLRRVREQLGRCSESSSEWTVAMRSGMMGTEVAEFAASLNADVIICGRGRHKLIDRLLGEEHLLRLLRATRVPLLAAEPSLRLPARRVVIAVDFSERNLASAQASLPYIADDATVYLVHVKPEPPFGIPHPGNWIRSYEDGVRTGLRRFQDRLSFSPMQSVEAIVLSGHPGVALAEFARASRCDLLVTGAHGSGFWNRLVIGSVTTHLIRAESCSLLLVPGPQ
jgi:nucleotide-binding universal stress UspA family protein